MSVLTLQDNIYDIRTKDVIKFICDNFFQENESIIKIVQEYLHKSHPLCSSTHVYRPCESYPSDNTPFKNAFKSVFDRLKHEGTIEIIHKEESCMHLFGIRGENKKERERQEREVYERLYKYALNGLCFGQAAAYFQTMERQTSPEREPIKITQTIDLADVIYIQLRYHLLPRGPSNFVRFYFPPREPNDHIHAIPWHETVSLIDSDVIKRERRWVDILSSKVEEPYSMGRVSFRVNAKTGHTFAFWHLTEEFGYFNGDGGNICQFSNCKTFCKAVRHEILKIRRCFGQLDSQEEIRAYHYEMREDPSTPTEYFPLAIYIKPRAYATIYQRYAQK